MNRQENQAPLTDYIYSKASRARIPLSGTFELSPVCNFACRMCYVRKTAGEVATSPRPILTLEQWLRIAEEAREGGMLYLLLTGGEPLLWPDFWELYEALVRMGFLVSINTNGSMIDDEAVKRFKRLPPKRINITLYGAGDDTYEALCGAKHMFSRVDHAITALRQAGILVKLNCSLTPYNLPDLEQMVSYAEERKLILQVATYMFPPVRRDERMVGHNDRFTSEEAAAHHLKVFRLQNGEEKYRQFLRSIVKGSVPPPGLDESCVDPLDGKIRCRAGKASYWITWDGWLTPCGMMPEPKVELVNRSFLEAWRELVEISGGLKLSGVCQACKDQQLCHSCAAMAVAETGTPSGIPAYLCRMVEELRRLAEAQLAAQIALEETGN